MTAFRLRLAHLLSVENTLPDEALPERRHGHLSSGGRMHLLPYAGNMFSDRHSADVQTVANFLVRDTGSDVPKNFDLAWSQPVVPDPSRQVSRNDKHFLCAQAHNASFV